MGQITENGAATINNFEEKRRANYCLNLTAIFKGQERSFPKLLD